MILQFTCPCGHVFRCAKAAPGESRGVCAACREPISEAMEAAAVPAGRSARARCPLGRHARREAMAGPRSPALSRGW